MLHRQILGDLLIGDLLPQIRIHLCEQVDFNEVPWCSRHVFIDEQIFHACIQQKIILYLLPSESH